MSSISINGADLTYHMNGKGAPLIFMHGFLANGTGEYYVRLRTLLAASFEVYSIDMRSHGGSALVTENVTLEQCAHDVAAFADALHLKSPPLVGHSMGGFIGMAAATQSPDRFKALALLTPAASKGSPTTEAQVADFMAARANRDHMNQRFAGMFVKAPDQAELDTIRRAALCLPDEIAEQWIRKEWPESDLTGRLASIRLPVLSLIGVKDVVVSPQRQYEDAMQLPHAKVVTLTDEGHMLPVEKPEVCASEILRFLHDLM